MSGTSVFLRFFLCEFDGIDDDLDGSVQSKDPQRILFTASRCALSSIVSSLLRINSDVWVIGRIFRVSGGCVGC